jgi:hypothetical protein
MKPIQTRAKEFKPLAKQARPASRCGDSSGERDTPEKAGDPQLAVAEDGGHRPLAQEK